MTDNKTNQGPSPDAGKTEAQSEKAGGKTRRTRRSWKKSASVLKQALADAQLENAELKDKFLRNRAEFQNYRRRVEEEKRDLRENARARSFGEILHLFDLLDMALLAAEQGHNPGDLIQGLRMIENQWQDLLKSAGVTEVPGNGEKFNPSLHEAVRNDITDEMDPGTITAVLRKGFKLKDKILRVSQVAVAAQPAEEKEEPAAQSDKDGAEVEEPETTEE